MKNSIRALVVLSFELPFIKLLVLFERILVTFLVLCRLFFFVLRKTVFFLHYLRLRDWTQLNTFNSFILSHYWCDWLSLSYLWFLLILFVIINQVHCWRLYVAIHLQCQSSKFITRTTRSNISLEYLYKNWCFYDFCRLNFTFVWILNLF